MCEEDGRLFEAAKRAQVNRNTAIHIIDEPQAGEILAGSFVRVLLEMPSRREGYLVARIQGTSIGEPYSGFSTNTAQTTTIYLMLELPPALAAINGVQYQLNSVSNSTMGEGEFREWLSLIRNEPTLRAPTVQQLEEVAAHLHPYEVSRHRPTPHSLATSGNLPGNSNGAAAGAGGGGAAVAAAVRATNVSNPPQRALSARAQARQIRQSLATSAALGGGGGGATRSPAASVDIPPLHGDNTNNGGASSPSPTNGSSSGANGAPHPSASYDAGAGGNYNANRYLRQGTVMSRDLNRNPREDGQASHDMADAEASSGDLYHNNNNSGNGNRRSTSPRAAGNGPASAAAIPFMTRGAVDHKMESEDEETERRLRQDIMNHLAQECVLFPKDATGFKLSRLRLLERDMIEYLQHVRDEIQGKQENCIVCLDHVPTVILLPCKHKVMCRLCAPSVAQCPVCRSQIAEMFEPEEV